MNWGLILGSMRLEQQMIHRVVTRWVICCCWGKTGVVIQKGIKSSEARLNSKWRPASVAAKSYAHLKKNRLRGWWNLHKFARLILCWCFSPRMGSRWRRRNGKCPRSFALYLSAKRLRLSWGCHADKKSRLSHHALIYRHY